MLVQINGWKEGFLKVSFTKLQMEYLGLALHKAKRNTDKLLDDEILTFSFEDEKMATEFSQKAEELGVIIAKKQ